jgi:integrase
MASLRARHSRLCALGGIETRGPLTERARIEGCTCKPLLSIRGARGANRERVGRDVRDALRALAKRNVQEGDGDPVVVRNLRFGEWAERWRRSLERKETTRDSYRSTVAYANEAFGSKPTRKVSTSDVAALNRELTERGIGPSTRAKHLRVLSACFESAIAHGYAASNPVKRIPKGEKPRPRRREAAYFEDAELGQLVPAASEGLHRTLLLVALKTGTRLGELSALTWGDVDLQGSVIHVRRSITDGHLGAPKSHEKREVELTEDLVRLLGEWWGSSGLGESAGPSSGEPKLRVTPVSIRKDDTLPRPDDSALVFPRPLIGDYLPQWYVLRHVLFTAMKTAGIPREGPTGELRTFHSLRHTYARICLEHGLLETWLQRQLGHSSLAVTVGIYGHWSKKGRAEQAAKLEGAFVV